jgi:hypothetical protein
MMRLHPTKSHAIRAAICLAVFLTISGCTHYKVDFSLNNAASVPKGKSIAIISGTKESQNVTIARMVADSLRKNSRYQVATVAQISRSVEPYPQNIKGPYKSAYYYIDKDWDLGDRKKIADIQHALGVDYLYVIWSPIAVSSNGNAVYSIPAIAQLFEQPNAREIAKTSIQVFSGDDENHFLQEGVDEIARQLAEETRMLVVAKK